MKIPRLGRRHAVYALVVIVGAIVGCYTLSMDHETGTISRVYETSRGGESVYYVAMMRDDGQYVETFENEDSWAFVKFNSAHLQDNLIPGQRYRLTVVGVRFPLFSWFRNIISARPIK